MKDTDGSNGIDNGEDLVEDVASMMVNEDKGGVTEVEAATSERVFVETAKKYKLTGS